MDQRCMSALVHDKNSVCVCVCVCGCVCLLLFIGVSVCVSLCLSVFYYDVMLIICLYLILSTCLLSCYLFTFC